MLKCLLCHVFLSEKPNTIGKRLLGNKQTLSSWAWYGKVRMNRFYFRRFHPTQRCGTTETHKTDKSRTFYLWMSLGRPSDCQAYEKFTNSSIANGPNSNEIVSYPSFPATQGVSVLKITWAKISKAAKTLKNFLASLWCPFPGFGWNLSLVCQCFCSGWKK